MLQLTGPGNATCDGATRNKKKGRATQMRATQIKTTTAYAIRKERKRLLMEQAASMQSQLDDLKFRLLVKQGHIDQYSKRATAENVVLHEFIQEQHVALATTQSALTGHVQRSLGAQQPAQCVIHLGADRVERYNTLVALKERKLSEAERYLITRSQGLEPGTAYRQEERFETPDGDVSVIRFETAPIRWASTKAVFDAILGSIQNAEMVLSEMFGSITIREDSEFESSELLQLRLVTLTSHGVMVESNTVAFSKFLEGSDSEYGIIAEDFVDLDDVHPYRSAERVRRDSTTLIMVRTLPQPHGKPQVVMVTRWTCLKIHSSTDISRNPDREMMESSVCWGDTAPKCVEQQLMNTAARLKSHLSG